MSNSNETMPCPFCTDGEISETFLIGDGQQGVKTRIESETKTCPSCEGTNEIVDPEAGVN